jgi:hypothetical protein
MSELIYFSGSALNHPTLREKIPGVNDQLKLQYYMHPNAGIKDRSGTLESPFRTKILSPIPDLPPEFNLSYKDCVLSRMAELERVHLSTGKTFRLLYSGGIDSTVMLAGFIEYFGLSRSSQLLEICCTPDSIDENPWAWARYIGPGNFKIKSSMQHHDSWTDDVITVMGEGNDHLFSSMGNRSWSKFSNDLYAPVDPDVLVDYLAWLKPELYRPGVEYCAEQYLRIAQKAPFAIDNMYLLNWWCKFVLDWEAVQVRVLVLSRQTQFPEQFLDQGLVQFFNTVEFQQWSMWFHKNNPNSQGENRFYKKACKDTILEILDIPEYAEKNKLMSWPRVQCLIRTGCFLDSDLTVYHNPLDLLKFAKNVL